MKKRKFKTNRFYHYASQYIRNITEEQEIMKIDMTQEFWEEIEIMIRDGEIIIIEINAKMRLGKSTLAITIAKQIHQLLKKHKQITKNKEFGIKNIARDQQEYSTIMRNQNTRNTVIATDESNALEGTGENVTVEKAMANDFSNIHAARYVHRVNCSPREQIDPNADIILQIISVDKIKRITHAKLYYKTYEAGTQHVQLIGTVSIPVGKLIKNWENHVKKLWRKNNKTTNDNKTIQKWIKKDYFVEYMIRKHQKMELLTKEGIFRPRTLMYAEAKLEVIKQLKPLAEIRGIINHNIIRNYIKAEYRKRKIPQSIIGEELSAREVGGILDLYKATQKLLKKLTKTKDHKEIKHINKMNETIENNIITQEKELQRLVKINKEYNEIQ